MEKFDLIVIGSGAGLNVASRGVYEGMKVALVEHGLLGGTCLNTGCIPSKILIYPADCIRTLDDAKQIGIVSHIDKVDFQLIMKRMRALVDGERKEMEEALESEENLTMIKETAEFSGDHLFKAGSRTITAPKIVIASGARALIPPIPGLREAGFLDNVSAFALDRLPESLAILGGGYIACEFGHLFSAFGTQVTIIGRNPRLLKSEDADISDLAKKRISAYMRVYTNAEAFKVEVEGGLKVVYAKDGSTGEVRRIAAEEILVAVGRRSNSDLLKPEKTGVKTDKAGWIIVNEYLETTAPGIWAIGDAIGKHMFRHTANYEASIVSHNIFDAGDALREGVDSGQDRRNKSSDRSAPAKPDEETDAKTDTDIKSALETDDDGTLPHRDHHEKRTADFHAVPHAVFTHPQVAGVGMTEDEAKASGYEIVVGRSMYRDTAKGYAMDEEGMAKAIVDAKSGIILGFHVVGSSAPELVQQVAYLMNAGNRDFIPMARAQVIHPAISEVVVRAFGNLSHPEHRHEHQSEHED